MPLVAVALLLAAAGAHATWNYYAKGARNDLAFQFSFCAMSALLYLPVAAVAFFIVDDPVNARGIAFVAASATLHILYYFLLAQGYRVGDLSLVYPLARGTGPVLAVAGAVVLFGERPTPLALAGAALVTTGILVASWTPDLATGRRAALSVAFAIATGACTAAYTLWDSEGVDWLTPVLYSYGLDVARTAYFAPFVLATAPGRRGVASAWRDQRRALLAIGALSPAAYMLVLAALRLAPVSYVAPAREISILFGTIIGARLLGEPDAGRRLAGAGAIVLGVFALAIG